MNDLKMNHIIFNGYLLISQFQPELTNKEIDNIMFLKQCEVISIIRDKIVLINANTNFDLNTTICNKIFKHDFKFIIISPNEKNKIKKYSKAKRASNNLNNFSFVNSQKFLFVN